MSRLSKEIGAQGAFENSMKQFISDPEMSQSLSELAAELLGRTDIKIGATSRGFLPKEHAFNPHGLDTHLDGIYAFGVYPPGVVDTENEMPAVVYSFNLKKAKFSSLDILQIQAVQSYPKGVPFKRWEPFGLHLIEMFGEWRKDIGATMVRPVAENNWLNNFPKDSASYKSGRLRYDIGSQRAGYAFEPQLNRFIKYLP